MLRRILSTHTYATICLSTPDGKHYRIRKAEPPMKKTRQSTEASVSPDKDSPSSVPWTESFRPLFLVVLSSFDFLVLCDRKPRFFAAFLTILRKSG